jgi:hypothetical protein
MTAPILTRADVAAPSYDSAATPRGAPAPQQPVVRRLLERFALIALGLYHLPLFLNNYPSLGGGGFNDTGLAPQWGKVFTIPSIWVAKTILHIANPSGASGDNGDASEEYARLLISIVVGLVVAIAWTMRDRKRPRGEWVESTTRVMLRFAIVLGLLSYAIAKLYPQQFPPIALSTLDRRVGDLTPMALLWTFMEYSRPYAIFGGLMELTACVLLCFRRTATLGALVCVAVMTNVTLMNYLYAVPVKLYATMITLSAAVLVLYDAPRLWDFFVRNRAVGPSTESTVAQDRVPAMWRHVIKVAAVGSVALSSIAAMGGTVTPPPPSSPIEGMWTVTSATPTAPWTKLIIDRSGIVVRTTSDSAFRCRSTSISSNSTLSLTCPGNHTGDVRWTRDGDTLRLDGTLDRAQLSIAAKAVDRANYLLMRTKFRWIFD